VQNQNSRIVLLLVAALINGCSKHSQPEAVANASLAQLTNIQVQTRFIPLTNPVYIGTLLAVDKQNHTVTIAMGPPEKAFRNKPMTFLVVPETELFKDQAPGSLDDAVVEQEVSFGARRGKGTDQLTVLRFLTHTNK
jgi:hypothetical protein